MDIETVAEWAALITAVTGAGAWQWRSWSKIKTANNTDQAHADATTQLLTSLRSEIIRLEGVIERLNNRIGELETSINDIRLLEVDSSADFGALEQIVNTMPCATCKTPGQAFMRLADVIDRMRVRRLKRHAVIGVE